MKKNLIAFAALVAAMVSFTNCAKETPVDSTLEVDGIPYEIYVSPNADTKTSYDTDGKLIWSSSDALTVFHAEADGTSFSSNTKFPISDPETGKFTGTLTSALATSNDWYVMYPYNSYVKTPKSPTSGYISIYSSQTQTGNSSFAHTAGGKYVMVGRATGVASGVTPAVELSHISSLIQITVTNNSAEPLTVTSIAFTANENISGNYLLDFSAEMPSFIEYSSNLSGVTLTVSDGEAIAVGDKATFYLGVKPFTATAGESLSISVNGSEKIATPNSDITFEAGAIKNMNFSFETIIKPNVIADGKYWIMAGNLAATPLTGTSGYMYTESTIDGASTLTNAFTFTKVDEDNCLYTIQSKDGKYVYQSGTANTFTTGVKAPDGTNNAYYWQLYAQSDGTYKILNYGTQKYIQYESQYGNFSCKSSEFGVMPKLVAATTPVPEIEFDKTSLTFDSTGAPAQDVTYTMDPTDATGVTFAITGTNADKFSLTQSGTKFTITPGDNIESKTLTATLTATYKDVVLASVDITQNAYGVTTTTEIISIEDVINTLGYTTNTSLEANASCSLGIIDVTYLSGGTKTAFNYSNKQLRLYKNSKVKFSSSKTITKLVFTKTVDADGTQITPDSGSMDDTGEIWTGESKEIIFTVNTKGQYRITEIAVTYY